MLFDTRKLSASLICKALLADKTGSLAAGVREQGGCVDREALVRKKSLASFHGKSAVEDQDNDDSDDDGVSSSDRT